MYVYLFTVEETTKSLSALYLSTFNNPTSGRDPNSYDAWLPSVS